MRNSAQRIHRRERGRAASLLPTMPRRRHGNRRNKRMEIDSERTVSVSSLKDSRPSSYVWFRQSCLPSMSAGLLGVSVVWCILGLIARFEFMFADSATKGRLVTGSVVGMALLSLAVGVRVPHQFAAWLGVHAWRRFAPGGRATELSNIAVSPSPSDRSLHWLVLSVIAFAAGLLTGAMPVALHTAKLMYAWLHLHFVWSLGPLAVMELGLIGLAGLLPFAALGLAMACVHHLRCPWGRWDPRPTAWLLFGAALGSISFRLLDERFGASGWVSAVASLPVLCVALLTAMTTSSGVSDYLQTGTDSALILPGRSDRWPRLMRAATVAVGSGGAFTLAIWLVLLSSDSGSVSWDVAMLLCAAGLGVMGGCAISTRAGQTMGAYGTVCTVAGLAVAVGAIGYAGSFVSSGGGEAALNLLRGRRAVAMGSVVALGFAAAWGRKVLFDQVANRSSVGATVMSRMFRVSALLVWIGVPFAGRLVGYPRCLVGVGVLMLALGGALIIHEPGYSPRARRFRLAMVFASIGLMVTATWTDRSTRETRGNLMGASMFSRK